MRPLTKILCLFAMLMATDQARPLHAELILDDFDDAALVVTPAMLNDFVDTPNVGDLDALRSIRIFGLQTNPVGRIDIHAAGSSAFVASLDELNAAEVPISKFVSVQTDYLFARPDDIRATVDVSEDGSNNAILLDFHRLTSAINPRFFRVIVTDAFDTFESVIFPVPLAHVPFTAAFPFDSFQFRGGGVGLPDFTQIRSFEFTMRVISGAGPPDLDFRMELDRIRFGRIAEPHSGTLGLFALAMAAAAHRARRHRPSLKEKDDGKHAKDRRVVPGIGRYWAGRVQGCHSRRHSGRRADATADGRHPRRPGQ
jgi:hypothetical protein